MEKISSFLNFNLRRSFFGSNSSKFSTLPSIFATLEFVMPLLFGIAVGWLGSVFIEYSLSPRSAELQLNMAANIAAAQNNVAPDNGLSHFLSANPFSVSAFPSASGNEPVQTVALESDVELKDSFAKATLTGTFPNVGAWMQDNIKNEQNFIPIGESFDVYKLTEVLYDRAIFQDEGNNDVTKFLYLVDMSAADKTVASAPSPAPAAAPAPQPAANPVIAAVPGGQEGVITRDDVNNLLMNPFDEMKKFRMRPKFSGNESTGIEIQWLQSDSVLGKLGVQKSDVIKSVNGIPMKNMGDIANAINSLMNGSRFDVEVMRGNAPMQLTYVVK